MLRAVTNRKRRLTSLVPMTLGAVLVVGCAGAPGAADGNNADPVAHGEADMTPEPDWRACTEEEVSPSAPDGAEDPPDVEIPDDLRCAEVGVAVDHDHPGGRTTALQVAKLPHTGDGESRGTVLYVDGGPGSPGIPTLAVNSEVAAELREDFEVVTWNARGTMGETAELLPHEVCGDRGPEFVSAQTEEEFDEVVAEHEAVADECRDHDPDLFDAMNTLQHVGDMEAIRAGLGEEQLNLYAHSHGGVRATAYAELHPERLSSVFLDSIVNWVSDREHTESTLADELESQFADFGQWCAESEECALRGEDVEERWQTLLARAHEDPIPAGAVSLDRAQLSLTGASVIKAEETWEAFAEAIGTTLEDGDATPFLDLTGGNLPITPNLIHADRCGDWVPYDDFEGYQEATESAVGLSDNFGHGQAVKDLNCASWPYEGVNPPGPIDAEEPPPFLLAASELEYANSAPAVADVPGSATVKVEGTGHGLYFHAPNSCLIEHVNRYFVDGTLPGEGAYCELD
ncbi:alpha/beta fold hydrolase [Nocardiopsis oceani]